MPARKRNGFGITLCVQAHAPCAAGLGTRRAGFTLLTLHDRPAQMEISCLYCGTVHTAAKETKTRRISFEIRPLSVELERSKESWSQKVECPTCSRKYTYIESRGADYVKNHTRLTRPVIESLKMLGIDQKGLEIILEQDLRIATYKQFRKVYFDIRFNASGQKLYIHCEKTKDGDEEIFLALNIGGGRLG